MICGGSTPLINLDAPGQTVLGNPYVAKLDDIGMFLDELGELATADPAAARLAMQVWSGRMGARKLNRRYPPCPTCLLPGRYPS